MRSGSERSIEFEALAQCWTTRDSIPGDWAIFCEEVSALERMDVPYFGSSLDSRDLYVGDRSIAKDYFECTGRERLRARIRSLGETDCLVQERFIRAACSLTTWNQHGAPSTEMQRRLRDEPGPPLAPEEFIAEAERIAAHFQNNAIQATDGSATWLGIQPVMGANHAQFGSPGDDLYCRPRRHWSFPGRRGVADQERPIERSCPSCDCRGPARNAPFAQGDDQDDGNRRVPGIPLGRLWHCCSGFPPRRCLAN